MRRGYAVLTAAAARILAGDHLRDVGVGGAIGFGLPEIDDRYHVWRVPLVARSSGMTAGEIVIDAYTRRIDRVQSTRPEVIAVRLSGERPAPGAISTQPRFGPASAGASDTDLAGSAGILACPVVPSSSVSDSNEVTAGEDARGPRGCDDARSAATGETVTSDPGAGRMPALPARSASDADGAVPRRRSRRRAVRSPLESMILDGDAEAVLADLPAGSVDLVFTSPPYYNARPGYGEFATYEDYLAKLRRVIRGCHRALAEGRFFVINISPVLIRRQSRGHASKRLAVPFDVHGILVQEGFDFVDDIIWLKPEGAGWATGRGRRFAADRQPLQYKPVPVTEYVLVYRKRTDRLIDWHLRTHHDPGLVEASRIGDDYERTNVWRIKPAHSAKHPAIFPTDLAERVVRYYSFMDDVVLDPYAGIGTTGAAAAALGRRYVLIDRDASYGEEMRRQASGWGAAADR